MTRTVATGTGVTAKRISLFQESCRVNLIGWRRPQSQLSASSTACMGVRGTPGVRTRVARTVVTNPLARSSA